MEEKRFYDSIIIGGGPAGLTAALYLARAKYRVLVLEQEKIGGQINLTEEIVNYPGVETSTGAALTETMRKQAERFGAEFLTAQALGLSLAEPVKTVQTSQGTFSAFGVLIATGAHPRTIGFPGESEFRGRGVAYCATCDGEFFTGKEVFVVGGGYAAAEESVFLTRYASHVTILMRKGDFSCAASVAEPARNHPKITILPHTEIVEASGDTMLRRLRYRNNQTGEETEFAPKGDTFGIFVLAGYAPETALVKGLVETDEAGYICTDRNQRTNLEGVYAAGDVCVKNLRQVVTAVGDGAIAATELERYAAAMQQQTGLRPKRPVAVPPKVAAEPSDNFSVHRDSPFSEAIQKQLAPVFSKMQNPLILELHLDDRPISAELRQYMEGLAALTEKLTVKLVDKTVQSHLPAVKILRADGSKTGLVFHGVPGGHEFTSFVLGLYNASGPGQAVEPALQEEIRRIPSKTKLQLLVSLSCTMCPELVTAAQRIATLREDVTAEVYDVAKYPDLQQRYQVMSVPCLVVNENRVKFGKQNLKQLTEWLLQEE